MRRLTLRLLICTPRESNAFLEVFQSDLLKGPRNSNFFKSLSSSATRKVHSPFEKNNQKLERMYIMALKLSERPKIKPKQVSFEYFAPQAQD